MKYLLICLVCLLTVKGFIIFSGAPEKEWVGMTPHRVQDILIPIKIERTNLWYELDGDAKIYYRITLREVKTGKYFFINNWYYELSYREVEDKFNMFIANKEQMYIRKNRSDYSYKLVRE